MKKNILALVLSGLLPLTGNALDTCFTGSWYEPATDGEGINIEVTEDTVVGYFYTWKNGSRDMYVLSGYNTQLGFATADAFASYLAMGEHTTEKVGTIALESGDENTLYFAWDWKTDWKTGDTCRVDSCVGTRTLTRLTQPIGCD